MPRALFLCLTIVAAFPAPSSAAPPISDEAPIPASLAAVAVRHGLDPARHAARFVAEFARLLHTPPEGRSTALAMVRGLSAAGDSGGAAVTRAPIPLSAELWSNLIFRRQVPAEQLVLTIMADRRAALLAHAFAALDDDTLSYLAGEPSLLARLYQAASPAFGAFGASLRVAAGRVLPAGGPDAYPLWELVVGERLDQPDRFIRALFELHGGRLAYLYDAIAQLDEPRRRFALGLWIPDEGVRQQRFAALVAAAVRAHGEWRLDALPFTRPLNDVAFLLLRVAVTGSGAPKPPASLAFWTAVLATDDPNAGVPEPPTDGGGTMDAAFLVEQLLTGDMYTRGDRLDQFAFAQRVIGDAASGAWGDAIVAVRAFPRYRMLMLAIERMEISSPGLYTRAARAASRLSPGETAAFWTLAQFQGALAIVGRAVSSETLAPAIAQELIASLCSVTPTREGMYRGALAAWLRSELVPRLPSGFSVEERVLLALAGRKPAGKERSIRFEGAQYRLDLALAELRRLHAVRARQGGPTVDLALALHRVLNRLGGGDPAAADAASAALAGVADGYAEELLRSTLDVMAPGVAAPTPPTEQIKRIRAELERAGNGRDRARRIERAASQLAELVDLLTGEALLTLAYAADIGHPEGAALLARNVALRHDFGLTRVNGALRQRTPWAQPRQDFLPGVPWHVTGSLLGLDLALAPLALSRINPDRLADAPQLPSNEREGFAVGVALIDPRRLTNADRDAIAAGLDRGRQRIAGLVRRPDSFAEVADALSLDGWRRRAIRWMLIHELDRVPEMFALSEVLALGEATVADLDAWGTPALQMTGCPCTRFVSTRRWRLLGGRPQVALMSAAFADLNLRIAAGLAALDMPAPLAKIVLSAAVQEFIEETPATDPNDWWTLVAAARAVPRERIEDYVAAAAAVGGPLVPAEAPVEP